jgi:hypothetical protein
MYGECDFYYVWQPIACVGALCLTLFLFCFFCYAIFIVYASVFGRVGGYTKLSTGRLVIYQLLWVGRVHCTLAGGRLPLRRVVFGGTFMPRGAASIDRPVVFWLPFRRVVLRGTFMPRGLARTHPGVVSAVLFLLHASSWILARNYLPVPCCTGYLRVASFYRFCL